MTAKQLFLVACVVAIVMAGLVRPTCARKQAKTQTNQKTILPPPPPPKKKVSVEEAREPLHDCETCGVVMTELLKRIGQLEKRRERKLHATHRLDPDGNWKSSGVDYLTSDTFYLEVIERLCDEPVMEWRASYDDVGRSWNKHPAAMDANMQDTLGMLSSFGPDIAEQISAKMDDPAQDRPAMQRACYDFLENHERKLMKWFRTRESRISWQATDVCDSVVLKKRKEPCDWSRWFVVDEDTGDIVPKPSKKVLQARSAEREQEADDEELTPEEQEELDAAEKAQQLEDRLWTKMLEDARKNRAPHREL